MTGHRVKELDGEAVCIRCDGYGDELAAPCSGWAWDAELWDAEMVMRKGKYCLTGRVYHDQKMRYLNGAGIETGAVIKFPRKNIAHTKSCRYLVRWAEG